MELLLTINGEQIKITLPRSYLYRCLLLALLHRGFVVQDSDHVEIDGMVIKGLTDTLKFITTPVNREKICSRSNWSHEGIRIMTKKSGYGETDPNRGIRLRNVAFSDFGKHRITT